MWIFLKNIEDQFTFIRVFVECLAGSRGKLFSLRKINPPRYIFTWIKYSF